MKKKTLLFLFSLSVLAAMGAGVGCDIKDMGLPKEGAYDGLFIAKIGNQSQQSFVQATLKSENAGDKKHFKYTVTVTSKIGATKTFMPIPGDGQAINSMAGSVNDVYIIEADATSASLTLPVRLSNSADANPTRLELKPVGHQCFESGAPDKNQQWVRFCYSNVEASFDLKEASGDSETLILDIREEIPEINSTSDAVATGTAAPQPETPSAYTKDQLITRAINQSFSSRIEFRKVLESKLNAKVSSLNLLPHLGLVDYAGTSGSVTFFGFLKYIGDFAPFLLPDRWFHAKESQFLYDAEFYGWLTEKADSGAIAEELAYTVLSTSEQMAQLEKSRQEITQYRDQLRGREATGLEQIGASDDITSILNSIAQNTLVLTQIKKNALAALAQASGFVNPQAVLDVTAAKEDVDVQTPPAFDASQFERLTLERAYELKQMQSLLAASIEKKKGRFFNWLDPNGDLSGEIGFAFPAYIEIARQNIHELQLEKDELRSVLLMKLQRIFNDMNEATSQQALAIQGRSIEDRRVERLTANMNLGIKYTMSDLVLALEGQVTQSLLLIDAKYRYLVAWSRLNRLLYSGPYADLNRGKLLSPAFDQGMTSP